jgi:4-hydroxy-3-polyprenylbenzoate decarboxylase
MVVVVDEWVDVHDYGQVAWQVGANVDPGRDVEQASGPLDQLDHAPALQSLGGKLGLDATATWRGEGYTREWPEVARMSADVRRRVDGRWESLGIDLRVPGGGAAAPRQRRGWRRS